MLPCTLFSFFCKRVLLYTLHCKEQSNVAAVFFHCILGKMFVNESEWRLLCFDKN